MSSFEAPSTVLVARPGPVCPPHASAPWPPWRPSVPHTCLFFTHLGAWQALSPWVGAPQPSSLCPLNTHSFFSSQLPALPQRLFPDAPSHPAMGSHSSIPLPLIKLTPLICVIMDYGLSPPLDCRAMGIGLWLELPLDPSTEPAHGRGSRNSC